MKFEKIKSGSEFYSPLLREIHNPPDKLYAVGNKKLLHNKSIAVVGSRKLTSYGKGIAYKLSYKLASSGFTVVSGMALGIDAVAHEAALEAKGSTIAVLGSGVLNPTPKTNEQLFKRIVENAGLVISEYEPEANAHKSHFPERNRIISGLCKGVIIIEATERSGSLITARLALEQNREVFAVPGNINQPNSVGTNNLIKNGAIPVTVVEDILHHLGYEKSEKTSPKAQNSKEAKVLECINDQNIRTTNKITKSTNLSSKETQQTLTMLEIRGVIRNSGAGEWYIV